MENRKTKKFMERLEENTEESQKPNKKIKRWYQKETKNKKNTNKIGELI